MVQRSFRLSTQALADLGAVAEHLARLSDKSPNQTTALAWCIARGIGAVEAEPSGMSVSMINELEQEAGRMRRIAERWMEQARLDRAMHDAHEREQLAEKAETERLREVNAQLGAEIERLKAKPYIPEFQEYKSVTPKGGYRKV